MSLWHRVPPRMSSDGAGVFGSQVDEHIGATKQPCKDLQGEGVFSPIERTLGEWCFGTSLQGYALLPTSCWVPSRYVLDVMGGISFSVHSMQHSPRRLLSHTFSSNSKPRAVETLVFTITEAQIAGTCVPDEPGTVKTHVRTAHNTSGYKCMYICNLGRAISST
jgi:hypothetical protein